MTIFLLFTCECEVDDEEVHAGLSGLVVAEEGGEHGRVAHHDQRQQRPQQRELLRLRVAPPMQQAKQTNPVSCTFAMRSAKVEREQIGATAQLRPGSDSPRPPSPHSQQRENMKTGTSKNQNSKCGPNKNFRIFFWEFFFCVGCQM